MNNLKFDRTQKIALARIISDLIEADFIVEEGEMSFFVDIISTKGFDVSDSMLVDAKKMHFAKAVSWLKELDTDQREMVIKTLRNLAMSDGTCVPLEAIQILSLELALGQGAQVFSIPVNDVIFDNMKAIYVESEDGTDVSKEVEENFRSLSNELALAGFDLVLIPQVVADYKRMDLPYLKKVVKYMIPSIPESRVEEICHDLRNITTSEFCRNLLDKKFDIHLSDTKPSLLVKISESDLIKQYDTIDTARTRYMNFLKIELKTNVVQQVRDLMDRYRSMINCSIMVDSKPKTQKFRYYGFHRSLFELIAYSKQQKEYRLAFDLSDENLVVQFEPIDGIGKNITLDLHPKEKVLLYLIAKKSIKEGGLLWLKGGATEKKRAAIAEEYNRIYCGKVGHGKDAQTYDQIKDRHMVSHIRDKIKGVESVANRYDFIPEFDRSTSKMVIHINKEYLKIPN